MDFIFKHFWLLFILGTWIIAYNWKSAVQHRIKHQPELASGYDDLYKGFLFWFNVPWVLMGVYIITGQADSISNFFPPENTKNASVLFWYCAIILLNFLFLNWIFLKNGAEILAKHPGVAFIPQWSAKNIRYYSLGLVIWNLGCIFFLYLGGPGISDWPSKKISSDSEHFWKALFPIIFVGMWALIGFLIAAMGGWNVLAKHYPDNSSFTGKRFRLCSGRLGGLANYRSCIILGSNAQGLYLAVSFPFNVGHPSLFIPWPDITAFNKKGWLFSYVDFEFSKSPGNIFRISKSLAEKIAKESGGQLKL